jgi:uncharacterized membrane protein
MARFIFNLNWYFIRQPPICVNLGVLAEKLLTWRIVVRLPLGRVLSGNVAGLGKREAPEGEGEEHRETSG